MRFGSDREVTPPGDPSTKSGAAGREEEQLLQRWGRLSRPGTRANQRRGAEVECALGAARGERVECGEVEPPPAGEPASNV